MYCSATSKNCQKLFILLIYPSKSQNFLSFLILLNAGFSTSGLSPHKSVPSRRAVNSAGFDSNFFRLFPYSKLPTAIHIVTCFLQIQRRLFGDTSNNFRQWFPYKAYKYSCSEQKFPSCKIFVVLFANICKVTPLW